ncbi:unnamed protein product [Candidula unifasciata]|uniref:Carbohydrate sulfotransferase n=1 Tax=Candidula unifasciata TaxID=100452 RepID=A0A8S3ZMT6_9EUPU|nr:unnamed protein product [Candidula unifasciata]
MQKLCRGQDGDTFGLSPDKWAYNRIEINREGNYLYCPLLKAGSTFFRRMFYSLKEYRYARNPYTIPIEKALGANRHVLEDIMPFKPFSRLLSGYVDKLFAPNPYFWSLVGKHIIANFRTVTTPKSRKCGHDVTFEEFLRYVVNGEATNSSHRDAHFTPSYDQCKPCYLNYTILGKMETFAADVAYTLSHLGQNISKEELSAWATNSTFDAIMDSAISPFRWKTAIRKCMTWHEALVRVWRKLQIRGIILFEHKFPWSPEYTEKYITLQKFTDMVKHLHLNSEKEQFHNQKFAVLAEAYSNIPAEDLQKFVDVFFFDFQLFQYNPYPSYVFDVNVARQFKNRHRIFHVTSV